MEINDENLNTLSGYLQQTLSPDAAIRKNAESFLKSVESNLHYPILLLTLVDKDGVDASIRVSAAIMFKNYTKRNWRVAEDEGDKIYGVDRERIKQVIVQLMLKSPENIQKQLSDAIGFIGHEDFPDKWPDLLTEMVQKFNTGDFLIINGVLRTAHSLFKRYRHEFKSNALWLEIKYVLDTFAAPLTILFNATMDLAEQKVNDPIVKIIFSSLLYICKIFYSLNFQDLPEYFEDNMQVWMTHFHKLIQVQNPLLHTQDDDQAGVLEMVKSQICDNVALYTQKYDEEFTPYLSGFVVAVWNILITTGMEVKNDLLVCNAIQFLGSVAERPQHKPVLQNGLKDICEKIVIPNMQLRAFDEENFEDNPEEYIRRDMEGSDIDTRRRAACDLVRTLSKSFGEQYIFELFSTYIFGMLEEYTKNPAQNWQNKDVAMYLITSLVAKGQTQKHGVTQSSALVNVTDVFTTQILPDLQADNVEELSILKASSIKFIIVFRNQLSKEILVLVIPILVKFLTSRSQVVHSYAAMALERIFTVRGEDGKPAITKENVAPYLKPLMDNLFNVMKMAGSEENEYIMKAVMRTFSIMQELLLPHVGQLITNLTEKMVLVSKNPAKPNFNHYLFESICVAIKVTCRADTSAVGSFETTLFDPFQNILQNDVQEFGPYVFQILSLMLELHTDRVPETYMGLFPHLLQPVLWERPGNIPPLVRLLQAYIQKGATQIENISGLLGIFQKLLASKTNDHQGFYLLNSMIEFMSSDVLNPYLNPVFLLLFQRLTSSKTTKYVKSLIVFFSLYAIKFGGEKLAAVIDSIQQRMFGMVIEKIILPDLQKVSGIMEKKICAVGITNILTDNSALIQQYPDLWLKLLQCLIGFFELPCDESIPDDEHFIDVEDTPGYQTVFSQLVFAGKQQFNPVAHIADPKKFLAEKIGALSKQIQGVLQEALRVGMDPEAQNYLRQYLAAAGVTLT